MQRELSSVDIVLDIRNGRFNCEDLQPKGCSLHHSIGLWTRLWIEAHWLVPDQRVEKYAKFEEESVYLRPLILKREHLVVRATERVEPTPALLSILNNDSGLRNHNFSFHSHGIARFSFKNISRN